MPNPSPGSPGYAGQQALSSATSGFNAQEFLVAQMLSQRSVATVVRVEAVYPSDDPLGPVGTVDVLPLVAQINGVGEPTPHGTIFGLPYFRVQGGASAVILDPKPGDLGLAVFADRDISSVKTTKAPANPGSRRQNDMADGLYFGGFLNGTPTQYVRFSADGIELLSPTRITLAAPEIDMQGAGGGDTLVTVTGRVETTAGVTGAGIVLETHVHGGVQPGAGTTSPPT